MPHPIRLFTIGFTKKTAEAFFTKLQEVGVERVIDVRLNNNSQLAGFSKKADLAYFLRQIAGIDYVHLPAFAPTQDMLDRYKKAGGDWDAYAAEFLALIRGRAVENTDGATLDGACLLCSEDQPYHCHRRLVAEYLRDHWGDVEIVHLV